MEAPTGCEALTSGWWGAPASTATSFAFLAAAGAIWWRRRDLPTSVSVAAIGIGSILSHGPMPPGSEWIHDAGLIWVLAWIGLVETNRLRLWPLGLALSAVLALSSSVADPTQAVLGVVVVLLQFRSPVRRRLRLMAVTLLGAGALVGRLVDAGAWCDPDSLLQGHAVWHLAASAALGIWGLEIKPALGPGRATIGQSGGSGSATSSA